MGAWGYGLFQSDHDYDIVSDLTYEVGLDKLQSDAEARAGIADGERSDFYYTLYCPSDVKVVREYLETPNATGTSPLAKALTKWQAKASGPRTGMDYPDPGYIFVLLGACAMTLGCNLSADTLAAMTATFTECGLMPDALVQMENALVGPLAYQGEPYFFDSPGLVETANRSSGGVVGPGGYVGMNVASPGGLFRGPDDSKLIAKIKARQEAYKLEKEDLNICGAPACDSTQKKAGGDLLVCSKCRERKYCSKECQKDHWKTHKLICVKPKGASAATT